MRRLAWRLRLLSFTALAACGGGVGGGGALAKAPEPKIVSTDFTATFEDFANPERGFYQPLSTDLAHMTVEEVQQDYAKGYRLLYARIDLAAYRDADLPTSLLDRLDRAFAMARRGGVKLIVRAVYNYPQGETEYRNAKDAPLVRVLGHLAQLKPLWHRNADVIAFVQAGFVGAWGEWHASSNDLAAPANRDRIKDALLDAVPETRFVQFRYPPYIEGWVPNPPLLKAALAGNFRIGFHNDCFLASQTDVGTFDEDPKTREKQIAYLDRLGDVAPFGGETCNPADEPGAVSRTGCKGILAEGPRFNLTYLNDSYSRPAFHDRWIADGCMADVRVRMGYRVALVGASHLATATRGQPMDLVVVMRNTGWARILNPRTIQVLLRDPKSKRVRRITASGADPRAWRPRTDTTESLQAMVPADLAPGSYEVWIALPDADPRLAEDTRFAIRVANGDNAANGQRWDAKLGAFNLGTLVTVE